MELPYDHDHPSVSVWLLHFYLYVYEIGCLSLLSLVAEHILSSTVALTNYLPKRDLDLLEAVRE
jgi:hypothetical protein